MTICWWTASAMMSSPPRAAPPSRSPCGRWIPRWRWSATPPPWAPPMRSSTPWPSIPPPPWRLPSEAFSRRVAGGADGLVPLRLRRGRRPRQNRRTNRRRVVGRAGLRPYHAPALRGAVLRGVRRGQLQAHHHQQRPGIPAGGGGCSCAWRGTYRCHRFAAAAGPDLSGSRRCHGLLRQAERHRLHHPQR
mgnify:CR=1 FL=1